MCKSLRSIILKSSSHLPLSPDDLVALSLSLAGLLFSRSASFLRLLLSVYAPVVCIHQRLRLLVLVLLDQLQNALAAVLHPCVDEIMPCCDGKPVHTALGGFPFQVDLAHQARHFALPC